MVLFQELDHGCHPWALAAVRASLDAPSALALHPRASQPWAGCQHRAVADELVVVLLVADAPQAAVPESVLRERDLKEQAEPQARMRREQAQPVVSWQWEEPRARPALLLELLPLAQKEPQAGLQQVSARARVPQENEPQAHEVPRGLTASQQQAQAYVASQQEAQAVSPQVSVLPARPPLVPKYLATDDELSLRLQRESNWSASSFRLPQTRAAGQ